MHICLLISATERFTTSEFFPQSCNGGKAILEPKKNIYMYIWYISNTITFRQVAVLFGVCKSTAWMAVNRATHFLISIGHEFLRWHQGSEFQTIAEQFELKAGIPGVIGAIDGTHIIIKAPQNSRVCYYDRNKNFSIAMQAVVAPDKRFIDITCGEPGSLHDSRVLRRSKLYHNVQENYEEMFPNHTFLIGDSAYPASQWIVPSFRSHELVSEHHERFNKMHSNTRIVVENAFGLLKNRFRRLLHFTEQTDLNNVTNIVVSACILHNVCILMDDINDLPDVHENALIIPEDTETLSYIGVGSSRRDILFNELLSRGVI